MTSDEISNAPSLEYLGFDEDRLSDRASEGLRDLLRPDVLQRDALELMAADAAAAAEKDRLGYDLTTTDGKFFEMEACRRHPRAM